MALSAMSQNWHQKRRTHYSNEMSEALKITLTVSLTVLGGLFVFVLQRFVLEPLNDQSKVLGRITYTLYFYAREYQAPIDPYDQDSDKMKRYKTAVDRLLELAAQLAESSQGIRFRWVWSLVGLAPKRNNINMAIKLLTELSNGLFAVGRPAQKDAMLQNCATADRILQILRLEKW